MFFQELETERLFLKNIARADRDFIFAHFSDAQVAQYLFDADHVADMAGADEIIDFYLRPEPRGFHRWVLVRKADNAKLGTCGLHLWNRDEHTVEIGYDLGSAYWGNGYMREAMQRVITFATDSMHVQEINAEIFVDNARSMALVKKLGFRFEGITKDETFRGHAYRHNVYTLYTP